jgi:hypothetical protein
MADVLLNGGRKFEGPFLMLGILPAWPQELEQRADYAGLHTQLSSLFPIKGLVPQAPLVAPTYEQAVRPLVELKPRPPYNLKTVTDANLARVLAVMDRPRSARQVSRKLGISRPTADRWIRALGLAIGASLKVMSKRQGRHGPTAKCFWVESVKVAAHG